MTQQQSNIYFVSVLKSGSLRASCEQSKLPLGLLVFSCTWCLLDVSSYGLCISLMFLCAHSSSHKDTSHVRLKAARLNPF